MARVKLGIIGCGVIGNKHASATTRCADVELVAVADLIAERVRAVAEKYQVPKAYRDAESLIADKSVELVVLGFPTGTRTAVALKALRAGKHVLLEKPAAMNMEEVRQIARAQGDLLVGCGSVRFGGYQSTIKAQQFVASGALGAIRVVRIRAVLGAGEPPKATPPVWRQRKDLNGGGILVNWGVYDFDYMMQITGWKLRPTVVLAQAWPVPATFVSRVAPGSNAESHFAALVRCAGGEVISFERGEFVAAASDEAWQIIGDKGSLRMRLVPDRAQQLVFDEAVSERGVVSRVLWEGQESFDACNDWPIRDFADAILNKREPGTNLARIEVMQQVVDAIYASAASGAAVEIQ